MAHGDGKEGLVSRLKRPRGKALRGRDKEQVLRHGSNQSLRQYIEHCARLGNDPRVPRQEEDDAAGS
jgi:hypothetical protein